MPDILEESVVNFLFLFARFSYIRIFVRRKQTIIQSMGVVLHGVWRILLKAILHSQSNIVYCTALMEREICTIGQMLKASVTVFSATYKRP